MFFLLCVHIVHGPIPIVVQKSKDRRVVSSFVPLGLVWTFSRFDILANQSGGISPKNEALGGGCPSPLIFQSFQKKFSDFLKIDGKNRKIVLINYPPTTTYFQDSNNQV